jgi:hypothetical protein
MSEGISKKKTNNDWVKSQNKREWFSLSSAGKIAYKN